MYNIDVQTDVLINEIKKSKEYNQYQRLQDDLKQDSELYGKMNEYRKKRFYMHVNEDSGILSESDGIIAQFEDLIHNELVVEFLAAEQRYCKMVKRLNDKIMECLDIDIDFLEE